MFIDNLWFVYFINGMNAFDSFIHAMTTISTGGFQIIINLLVILTLFKLTSKYLIYDNGIAICLNTVHSSTTKIIYN